MVLDEVWVPLASVTVVFVTTVSFFLFLLSCAKAEVKARQSYNKKKAEEALNNKEVVEDNEVVIESTSEKPSAATQSTNGMYPMNVEVDKEDNLEQLDIKKTVAVSTKQTRLPIVSTEA